MSETNTKKKYCCSNRTPLEAINVGTFDLILSFISFGSCGIFLYFYHFKTDSLKERAENSKHFLMVSKFMQLSADTQTGIIIGVFTITAAKILQSVFLLVASVYQNSLLLRIWLISSPPFGLITSATALFLAYFGKEKLILGCMAIFYFLFQIYAFWVVREYVTELRTVSADSQLHLEDQKSPTGDED